MAKIDLTLGTRAEVELIEAAGGRLVNEERFKCDRGNRSFAIGDRLELHSLQEYPELNGEIVTITAYRESLPDQNGYYIKSDSGRVEKWLNFVWEGRLRRCESPLRADAKITELIRDVKDGDCALSAIFDDGSTRKLFSFFIDELAFFDADLLGKIQEEANQLHHDRTVAYMGRPQLARIVDRELSTVNQELLSLVRSAFDRFTDNDMQPPNNMLREWLDSAQSVIAKATRVAESNAMRHITVYMSDGDIISTNINGTDDEIMRHYLGTRFEAGSDTKHHVALCIHFHDTDKRYGLRIKCIEHTGVSGCISHVRKDTVKIDENNSYEEIMLVTRSDAEYALSDVWVYDMNGTWIEGIGYKHATT